MKHACDMPHMRAIDSEMHQKIEVTPHTTMEFAPMLRRGQDQVRRLRGESSRVKAVRPRVSAIKAHQLRMQAGLPRPRLWC